MTIFQICDFIFKGVSFFAGLFSIVYTFGVVWRVEKKLDVSYKLLLVAIIFFTLANFLGYLNTTKETILPLLINLSYALFSSFFLAGILMMRNLIRKVDGE